MAIDMKKLLSEALIELCNEKSLSKISVQDIIKKVGTSRQTFYNHFRDKNDIIIWTYSTHVVADFQTVDISSGLYEYLCETHRNCVKYKNFYTQACSMKGQNSLRDYILEQNYRNYLNLIIKRHGKSVVTDELLWALRFNAMGAIYMHFRWVEEGMALSPEINAKYRLNCFPEIVKRYLPD